MNNARPLILIVDDDSMNRVLLSDLLGDQYDILEAKDGNEALLTLQEKTTEISLVLLDMVMPGKNGIEVLEVMNKNGWIKEIPVVMISVETASTHVEKAYSLGVTDFIYRPFDQMVVQNRVRNTIRLYSKQKYLSDLVADQIYEKTRNSSMLITVLSHIVEFRNGESGMHVLHINIITDILLRALLSKTDKYNIPKSHIGIISTASSMHDIGKISIPNEILNKPGRLTPEEFTVMKQHSMNGAVMLENVPFGKNEPLMKYAYEICRWHHERWDGRGYPDGLKGDEIPIAAQIVSIADVYDALTSERCYKKAFTHEKALEMIRNNECGVFNPILLECLGDVAEKLRTELNNNNWSQQNDKDFSKIAETISKDTEHSMYSRAFRQFTYEHKKSHFFASLLDGVVFEYTYDPSVLKLSPKGAEVLGLPETIVEPEKRNEFWAIAKQETWSEFEEKLHKFHSNDESFCFNCHLFVKGQEVPAKIWVQQIWNKQQSKEPILIAAYGRISFSD